MAEFRSRLLPCVGLVVTMLVTGCSKAPKPADNNGPVPVVTRTASKQIVPLLLESVGRAEGSREIEIRARVSGILEKQTYSEGSTVKRGQVLFQIDPAPFEIALAHAKAALAQQEATAKQARRDSTRLTGLAAQNAVSRRAADDALSALDNAEAGLLAAQANVREAQLNLSYTNVTAPIAGIAGRSIRSEGSLVTAGTESGLLTTLTQSDPLWVRFALSDAEYATLREAGAPPGGESSTASRAAPAASKSLQVQLLQKNGEPYPLAGQMNFAGSEIDTQLGTVQLRAEFPNPALRILPGEYLRVRMSVGAVPAIVVPQTAVLQGAKGPFVWIVNDKQQAEQRLVQTGVWVGSDWQIRSGLAEGDRVIVDNLLKLKAGSALQIQSPAQARTAQP
ncbi:MAG: efflux RND transporter periplasmic adaptor subunit [Steroidobacteraceae bacterium]